MQSCGWGRGFCDDFSALNDRVFSMEENQIRCLEKHIVLTKYMEVTEEELTENKRKNTERILQYGLFGIKKHQRMNQLSEGVFFM